MKQLDLLWQLQNCDLKIQAMVKEEQLLNEQAEVNEMSVQLKESEYDLSNKRTQLEVDNEKIQRCNQKLKQINFNLKEVDQQLYGGTIRNIEKLQQLQQQNGTLKKEAKNIEDDILELMEVIEKGDNDVQTLQKKYRQLNKSYKEKQVENREKQSSIGGDIEEARVLREQLSGDIEDKILKKYDVLKQEKNRAVVKVQGDRCEGCHMNLPLSLINQLKQGKEIVYCENCGRFLYPNGDQ